VDFSIKENWVKRQILLGAVMIGIKTADDVDVGFVISSLIAM